MTPSSERDFKGVWIPKWLYLNEELSWTEKILLTEIDSLDHGEGAWASNKHYAQFLNLKSGDVVAQLISSLRKRGFVEDCGFDGRKRYIHSRLHRGNTQPRVEEKLNPEMAQNKDSTAENSPIVAQQNTPSNTVSNTINFASRSRSEKISDPTEHTSPSTVGSFEEWLAAEGYEEGEVYDGDGTPYRVWVRGSTALSPAKLKSKRLEWLKLSGNMPPKPQNATQELAEAVVRIWNQYGDFNALKLKIKPNNPTVLKGLLPAARVSHETMRLVGKLSRHHGSDDFLRAIKKYAEDIINRVPNGDGYHNHRMSLYDFLNQKNGFIKYSNR